MGRRVARRCLSCYFLLWVSVGKLLSNSCNSVVSSRITSGRKLSMQEKCSRLLALNTGRDTSRCYYRHHSPPLTNRFGSHTPLAALYICYPMSNLYHEEVVPCPLRLLHLNMLCRARGLAMAIFHKKQHDWRVKQQEVNCWNILCFD